MTEYLHVIFPGKDDTQWKKDSLILAVSTLMYFNGTTSLRARVGALKRGKIHFAFPPYRNRLHYSSPRVELTCNILNIISNTSTWCVDLLRSCQCYSDGAVTQVRANGFSRISLLSGVSVTLINECRLMRDYSPDIPSSQL